MIQSWPTFVRPHGVVAILDTSVLVRAWLSAHDPPNAALAVVLLAGLAYDSFTSPAILDEVREVLARPRFGADAAAVARWLDAFVRASRQVFPQVVPGGNPGAVRGDKDDLPILETAYAVYATAQEHHPVVETAQATGDLYLVSENSTDFVPGRNVHGFHFIRVEPFRRMLLTGGRVQGS